MNKTALLAISLALISSPFTFANEHEVLNPTSEAEQAAARSLVKAQELKNSLGSFLRLHAIEITREENFTQEGHIDGNISGKLDGGGKAGYLGNFPKLAWGLLQSTFGPAATMPLGMIAQGLTGIGYGSMSINGELSGSLHGEVHAKGEKINDDAHLYLIPAKQDETLRDVMGRMKAFKAKHPGLKTNLASDSLLNSMDQLVKNPYFVSVAEIKDFEDRKVALQDEINHLDEILSSQVTSKSEVFDRIQSRVEILKQWVRSKRYQIKTIGGLAGEYSIRAISDWKMSIPNPRDCTYIFARDQFYPNTNRYDACMYLHEDRDTTLACKMIAATELIGVVASSARSYLDRTFVVTSKTENRYCSNAIKVSEHVKLIETAVYPLIQFDAKNFKDIGQVIVKAQTRESRLGDL